MRSFCQLAVLALPLFSSAVAASPDKQADHPKTIYASAQEAFQDLLNALPEESLQAALSGLKDFKNGVFESHHRGVEHIHSEDPALATKLIVDAVNDLKKRQTPAGNGTTTVIESAPPQTSEAPPPQTSEAAPPPETTVTQVETQQGTTVTQVETQTQQQTQQPSQTQQQPSQPQQTSDDEPTTANPPPATVTNTQQQTITRDGTTLVQTATATQTTTQQRPAIIPVEATVTQDGTTIVRTTRVLSQVTASIPVTRTLTDVADGTTVLRTETQNRPAVIRTITDSAGRTTVTTSAADYAPTAGEVQTTTDEAGSTFLTTYTPGGGLVSSIKLITTTDAQGRPSTMTSYTFVDPIQATATGGGDSGDSTESPTVQSGAAVRHGAVGFVAGVGALAFLF
jgi:DNA polymerase III gamma/tau subunit